MLVVAIEKGLVAITLEEVDAAFELEASVSEEGTVGRAEGRATGFRWELGVVDVLQTIQSESRLFWMLSR